MVQRQVSVRGVSTAGVSGSPGQCPTVAHLVMRFTTQSSRLVDNGPSLSTVCFSIASAAISPWAPSEVLQCCRATCATRSARACVPSQATLLRCQYAGFNFARPRHSDDWKGGGQRHKPGHACVDNHTPGLQLGLRCTGRYKCKDRRGTSTYVTRCSNQERMHTVQALHLIKHAHSLFTTLTAARTTKLLAHLL
jgi:hypothetical protein